MTSAKQILLKTMPYVLARLAVGCAAVGVSVLMLLIWGSQGFDSRRFVPAFLIWTIISVAVAYLMMHYLGYRLRLGHIAIAAEATGANRLPARQLNWGNRHAAQLFKNADRYFSTRKLIFSAIREVQSCYGYKDIKSSFLPEMLAIPGLTQLCVYLFLKHIDECCLGWMFLNRRSNKYKNAADGVVIFGRNRRVLLANAAKILIKSAVYTCAAALVAFLFLGLIFKALGLNILLALVLAILVGWVAKFTLLDSYIMIRALTNFMKVAKRLTISEDMYDRSSSMSPAFVALLKKAQN